MILKEQDFPMFQTLACRRVHWHTNIYVRNLSGNKKTKYLNLTFYLIGVSSLTISNTPSTKLIIQNRDDTIIEKEPHLWANNRVIKDTTIAYKLVARYVLIP